MNSIRPLTVTLIAVAILFGLVTAYAAKRLLEPKPVVETVAPSPKTATVVVAQANLTEYTRITDRDVAAVEARPEDIPAGSMRVKARAVGRLVKSTILAGFPIREQDLYEPGTVPKIADQLPPGYVAVSVQVEDEIAANGAIQPGSLVDVSLTFDSDHPDVDGTATESILRQLKVLTSSPVGNTRDTYVQGAAREKTYVTLAATPEQANRLILAQKYGTVNVTLCSSNNKDTDVLGVGTRYLVNKFELLGLPPVPPPLVPVIEPPVRKVVEIYRGTSVQHVVFNEAGELLSTEFAMAPPVDTASLVQGATGERRKNAEELARDKCPTCNKNKKAVNFTTPRSGATQSTRGMPSAGGAPLNVPMINQPTPAVRPQPEPAESMPAPPNANVP